MTKCKILVRTLWGGDQLMFFSMTCTTDRTEYVKRLLYYLSFVINVYQNSEGYAGQSICQEKNHNILPLFCGTGKKQMKKIIFTPQFLVRSCNQGKKKITFFKCPSV